MGVYLGGRSYRPMQGPCPDGFLIPPYSLVSALKTMLDTILGRTAIGDDLTTYLFFPTQGYLSYTNGSNNQVGNYRVVRTCGWYSSGSYTNGSTFGSYTGAGNVSTGGYNRRGTGYPIRPFKFDPVIPDSTRTTLYNASSVAPGAGIFHNASLGLITVCDGTDYITIADKNLGATTTDTSSTNSYGHFYQWGNNYGFPSSGFTTSSTRVDASSYGPGNYYYSSTFITTSNNEDRSTVVNDDLWGGVTQFLPCSELREAYIGGRLPSTYQEVEWIGNSGTQYIKTNLNIYTGYRQVMKVRPLNTLAALSYPGLAGGYLGQSGGTYYRLYLNGLVSNNTFQVGFIGTHWDNQGSAVVGTDYEIDFSRLSGNLYFKLNGTTIQTSNTTRSTSLAGNVCLLGSYAQDGNPQYKANPGMRLYYSKFYNSAGKLVGDFVPCYRKSDSVIGMYDLVNKVFYTNSGTGTFTKGNNV